MDSNVLAAIVTSVATAGSTAGVAITALVLNNKRFDLLEKRLDKIETTLTVLDTDLKEFFKDTTRIKAKIGLD